MILETPNIYTRTVKSSFDARNPADDVVDDDVPLRWKINIIQ